MEQSVNQHKARLSALSSRKRRRLEPQNLALLHAAEPDEEWAPFEKIVHRCNGARRRRGRKSHLDLKRIRRPRTAVTTPIDGDERARRRCRRMCAKMQLRR